MSKYYLTLCYSSTFLSKENCRVLACFVCLYQILSKNYLFCIVSIIPMNNVCFVWECKGKKVFDFDKNFFEKI